jgi:hypothetical protein
MGSSLDFVEWDWELCPQLSGAYWSDYYKRFERTPDNITMAEWVARRYSKRTLK